MRPRILLVNPWIYDFAAYNLWARPLGLLKVAEYLSAYDVELALIDCTDSFDIKRFGAGVFREEMVDKPAALRNVPRLYRRYGIGTDEFAEKLRSARPFDAVMVTSIMSYWYPGVQKAVEVIREIAGDVPIVLGGIYATLYPEHAAQYSGADFVYKGVLDEGLIFALRTFGYRIKKKRGPVPYYRLGLYDSYPFAPLLTASGCPFECSYCASGLLAAKYERPSPDDVVRCIEDLVSLGVHDFAFYDDSLLFDSENHIKPVLRRIAGNRAAVRFHTPNGLHARFMDGELSGLMKETNFQTIRLSLETANADRQIITGGKVSNTVLADAVRCLKDAGFIKENIGVYLMYGLPGQPLGEVAEGVEFLRSLDVRINLTEFSPIRGTRSWDELAESGIINDDFDPLLTNNSVFSYLFSGYDPEEINRLKMAVKEYNAA